MKTSLPRPAPSTCRPDSVEPQMVSESGGFANRGRHHEISWHAAAQIDRGSRSYSRGVARSGGGVGGNDDERQAALPLRLEEVSVLQSGMRSRLRRWACVPSLRSRPGRYSFSLPRTMIFDRRHGFLRSSICKSPSLLITSWAAGYNTPALFFWS